MSEAASILVTGDLILDRNVVRLHGEHTSYRSPCPSALETKERGGAWYFADLLKKILPLDSDIQSPREDHALATTALSLWELMPTEQNEKKKKCWRVSEFVGCETPQTLADQATFWPEQKPGGIIVLDDVGSAFAKENGPWSKDVAKCRFDQATQIIGKTNTLDAPLWQALFSSEHAAKLTLVTSAAALRERGARISRALSWDAVLSDLQREMADGHVGAMLSRCKRVVVLFGSEGAATFSREPRTPDETISEKGLRFEQCVFDPKSLEGSCSAELPGKIYGTMSVLTVAVTASAADPECFPRFKMLCRALCAAQKMQQSGAGTKSSGPDTLAVIMQPVIDILRGKSGEPLPEDYFGVSFPRDMLDAEDFGQRLPVRQESLLTDLTGTHQALVYAKAEEIVIRGPKKAMRRSPRAEYGKYITYDRDEIERINSLRNLIADYLDSEESRPLSVAVFGQPGSGKSFAIKQLASRLFHGKDNGETFNLSQFQSVQDLHAAFHQVRDMALKGSVPLIFWDEFDTDNLRWLKDFLSPMQDGEFTEHGCNHPVGRSVFVFAGGTAHSFASFSEKNIEKKEVKAPDFISRLRGYVDIKGPNQTSENDHQYVIRRGLLLRNFLERYVGGNIIGKEGRAAIEPGVLKGLLFADKYQHGVRSMESIILQSHLQNACCFGPSELPPKELLNLHLTHDFMGLVDNGQMLSSLHGSFEDELARRIHEAWRVGKEAAGFKYAPERNDLEKKHPLLLPYDKLTEEGRERNLGPARVALARLKALGMQVIPRSELDRGKHVLVETLSKSDKAGLARVEHQRWMREYLIQGYVYGDPSSDNLRRHCDIRKFEYLPDQTAHLDTNQIEVTLQMLAEKSMVLVRPIDSSASPTT